MNNRSDKILFFFGLALACLPLIYMHIPVPKLMPLRGEIAQLNPPKDIVRHWWNAEFQSAMEEYAANKFTQNSTLLTRFYNQYQYTFYNTISTENVIEGKEGMLYEEDYITSYLGEDYVGEDAIHSRLNKVKKIQDSLAMVKKELLLVLAPDKASFYPENFPDKYPLKQSLNNYKQYVKSAEEQEVRFIDFNEYFLKQKKLSEYPLYPLTGIHWSVYGAVLSMDSIFSYLNVNAVDEIPNLYWEDVSYTNDYKFGDNDIEQAMNLLGRINNEKLAYPELIFEEEEKSDSNLLVLADSYYWTIYSQTIPHNTFKEASFWYYNNTLWDNSGQSYESRSVNFPELIEEVDGIVIMSTQVNLKNLGWGFIETLYKHLFLEEIMSNPEFLDEVEKMKKKIISNEGWYQSVIQKAESNGISIDSAMVEEAVWMLM